MRKHQPLAAALALPLLVTLLVGCDPKKDSGDKPADTTAKPTDTTSAQPTSGTPPTGATATSPFDTPRKSNGDLKFSVITNGSDPFWDTMGVGLTAGLKEAGVTGGWTYPTTTDNTGQKNTFDQQLAANVDGIAVSPIQADAFAPVIDDAIAKNIPVITFDSDSPTSKRLAYIGTDNHDAGMKAGEAAIKLFPNGGNLVAFVGNMSADNAKQRYQGFLDAVKGHNITMLQEPFEDNKEIAKEHSNVADAITKYGDKVNGFLGLYAYNGPAIMDEVQKAGKIGKIKIIAFDGQEKTLDGLQKKLIDAAIVQHPDEFGRVSAKLLMLINRKGLKAAFDELGPELEKKGMKVDATSHKIDTGVQVVTPETATEFINALHAKGLKAT